MSYEEQQAQLRALEAIATNSGKISEQLRRIVDLMESDRSVMSLETRMDPESVAKAMTEALESSRDQDPVTRASAPRTRP